MNKKNLLKAIIAVGASVVIATALFVNAGVGNPSASGKALPEKSNESVADSNSLGTGMVESAKASSASTEPTFTLKQLKSFNGQNGQPAYVAYKGVVYDLTAVSNWSSGKHHGISAGTDVTEVFSSSPHAVSILKMGFVVGTLEGFAGTTPAQTAP